MTDRQNWFMTMNNFFTSTTNYLRRHCNISAALIILFFLILFYRDVVFAGRTFLMETAALGTMPNNGPSKYEGVTPGFVANDPSVISLLTEPFNRFISKSVKRGDFPLWNPYAGVAGSSMLADGSTGPLEPLQFLFFFIPDRYWTYAVDIQLLLRFFLAGFFCYLFAQRLKIGFLGSVSAGLLFMLSSYFITFGNSPHIKTEMLLPAVLYGYDRLASFEDKQGIWLCALCIGWAIIAAMPESTFFVLFLGTLWYFYKLIFIQNGDHSFFRKLRWISIRYVSSTVLGFFISAAYLLPFLEFVLLSANAHSAGSDLNVGGHVFPLGSLFLTILRMKGRYFLHLGVFALFVLVFSFLTFKEESKFRRVKIFFSGYAAFFILSIFSFPLTGWIQEMPVFKDIVLYKYPVFSIAFCIALLSGIFVEEAYTKLSYKKVSIGLFITPLLFLVLPGVYDPQHFSSNLPDKQEIYSALYLFGGITFTLFFLTFLITTARLKDYTLQALLLLILIVEPFQWGTRIKRPDRYDPYFQHIPHFIHYLKNDNEIYRIFSLDRILHPNISTAYEMFDIRWINALIPQRTYDFSTRFLQSDETRSQLRFTGSALPVSDEMFDLLNVKYVLRKKIHMDSTDQCVFTAAHQPYFGHDTLHSLIIEQNQAKKNLYPKMLLNINGTSRMSMFAHPPDEFDLVISIPEQSTSLDFSIGLNPSVFRSDQGDGVNFTIEVFDNQDKFIVFTKYTDPKNDPCQRKWFDESVSLDQWAGKEITLRFSTNAGPKNNVNWDWAYWGDIRLSISKETLISGIMPEEIEPASEYEAVHGDANVEIFQNNDVYPRAFMIYDIMNVSTFNRALDLLNDPHIDLRRTAIVENFPNDFRTAIETGQHPSLPESVTIKRITPDTVTVETQTNSPGLLVISEQYYPGWHAYVDGKETPIYAVDGILRGVFLNEGKHTILLEYKPLSFSMGLVISIVSLLAAITGLVHLYKQSFHGKLLHSGDLEEYST